MTAQEILAFARIATLSKVCAGKKVVIQRTDNGLYLTRNPGQWSSDIQDARIYDYTADDVSSQLMFVENEYGWEWTTIIVA